MFFSLRSDLIVVAQCASPQLYATLSIVVRTLVSFIDHRNFKLPNEQFTILGHVPFICSRDSSPHNSGNTVYA
jgi:hypothetical protein